MGKTIKNKIKSKNLSKKKKKVNLVYMAKPPYGGWVSFTAHLSKKYDYDLFKKAIKPKQKKENLVME